MSGRGETFLGRWVRRKTAEPEMRAREDRRVDEERAAAAPAAAAAAPAPTPQALPPDLPPIESLTPTADFSRFMQADVPLPARNAALRKLFSDPHFNVMDGLDTYIDDYTRPDPIPAAMLRELAQSQMLRLFDEPREAEAAPAAGQAAPADAAAVAPDTPAAPAVTAAAAPDVAAVPDAPGPAAAPAAVPGDGVAGREPTRDDAARG